MMVVGDRFAFKKRTNSTHWFVFCCEFDGAYAIMDGI